MSQSTSLYNYNVFFPHSTVQHPAWGRPSQTSPYNARHPVGTIQGSGNMAQPGAGQGPAQRAAGLDPYHTVHNPASYNTEIAKPYHAPLFNFKPVINAAAVHSPTPTLGRASAPVETPKSTTSLTPSSLTTAAYPPVLHQSDPKAGHAIGEPALTQRFEALK